MSDENEKKDLPDSAQNQPASSTEEAAEPQRAAAISDEEKEAKLKRAAEARAARAAAKAAESGEAPAAPPARRAKEEAEEAKPKEPSLKQPQLDRAVEIIREAIGAEAVLEAQINDKYDMPTVTLNSETWLKTAELLKQHPELTMNYLRNVSGVDQESHLEVVYHFLSLSTKNALCVKIKTDRSQPSIPSITPLFPTADWNEREIFDLLGVDFPGHPDLRRIMLPDDWSGHPLRKDYEALDPEV